ncbi:MAG TPA: galactose oxidase [Halococcus sp.]|nr:galactose oxidase [Halococcus sp.]
MGDDENTSRPNTTRRTALRALGVGALAATAGCLFGGGDENPENRSKKTTHHTESGARETENEPTATHEHSIITESPAATGTRTTTKATAIPTGTRTPGAEKTTAGTTEITGRTPQTSTIVSPEPTTPLTTAPATTEPTPTTTERVGGWAEKTPLPAVGSDAGGGVLDGKLYFFGGIETATGLDAVSRTLAFDPAASTGGAWERLPDLPRALWGLCGVATDDAMYSFGGAPQNSPYTGEPPSDAIFRYRPDEGWTDLTASQGVHCPYPNWVMDGVYNPQDGLIYCVGGGTSDWDAESATDHGFDGEGVPGTYDESRLWTFDPESEQVIDPDLARMPEAKRWTTAALLDADGKQYLYAIGGLLGTTGPTDSNFRYDLDAGEWEDAQPTPRPGTYATHSNPAIDNRAYLALGMFWQGESTIERYKLLAHRYNPETDSFETGLPDPTYRRGGATSGVIDGTLYVVGGHIKRFEQDGLHDCVAYNEAYTPIGSD